jgi:hypothetical protein
MTNRHHIGQMLSQLMAIADAQVPHASTSWATATAWRAIVAYGNERLLGDELDAECVEEKRRQAEDDERISRQLRWMGLPAWFERWSA